MRITAYIKPDAVAIVEEVNPESMAHKGKYRNLQRCAGTSLIVVPEKSTEDCLTVLNEFGDYVDIEVEAIGSLSIAHPHTIEDLIFVINSNDEETFDVPDYARLRKIPVDQGI